LAVVILNLYRRRTCSFRGVIPEIDIWRAAQLMLKRYGDRALEESAARADELFAEQDHDGAAVWRRIIDAVGQLANTKPSGRPH
jgi:hypothetical protein